MAFTPSERRKIEIEEENLNLNPMMDMFAVLIPALLMLSAAVEVSIINVAVPAIGASDANQQAPQKPPLNLTVTVSENGYVISSSAGALGGNGAEGEGQAQAAGGVVPIVERPVICSRFRGTWPPPRSKNRDRPFCDPQRPRETRNFWVYDSEALTRRVMDLKDQFPEERRIIIAPGADIDYEGIVGVMDATRDVRLPNGELRSLFEEVVISPPPATK